jgi:2-keto-4-pentenoate hydratase/2-oxohepta-3-ene-1,7-dioic acid hydratase in catechol pathway
MRIATVDGRLAVLLNNLCIDVEKVSEGRFSWVPDDIFPRWDDFTRWAGTLQPENGAPFTAGQLGAPVTKPSQVFAIGLNYLDHAKESGVTAPDSPVVFTKFPSCLTGPYDAVTLPSDQVDWEVELVVVIGREAHRVSADRAWSHVAGLTVGQDLSERAVQLAGPAPQFSLGKSYKGFGPIGPWLVTPDELPDPDDLELSCRVGDEVLQRGRTSDMIFPVRELVAHLSEVCTLRPGDLIFTGTPPGVGMGRSPQRYLVPGVTLTSAIEGVGELRNPLRAQAAPLPAA